jgi:opacity protein-like surface antigen
MLRQYPGLDTSLVSSHAGSGGVSLTLGKNRQTTIEGRGSVTFQSLGAFLPFASFGDPILGQLPAPGQDFGGARTKYFRYSSSAGITQKLSRRATLSASYHRDVSDFTSGAQGLDQQSVAVRFTRGLSRYLSLRVGYGLTSAAYQYLVNGRDYQYHNIDTGVDYSRDLSLTRRTKLAFSTGAAAIREGQTTRYDVIGSASLNREIGRTWNALVAYHRNAGFIETIGVPTFSDSISASIDGLVSNRLSFRAGVGASRGNVGYTTTAVTRDGFDAVTGFAGLSRALTRNLALGLNYTYYRYNFEDAAVFVTPLQPRVNRHSVNVTLSAWAPVFKHGRKPNVTR